MPAVTSKRVGSPIWVELASTAPDRAAAFYSTILGATVTDPAEELGGYQYFSHDGALIAGLLAADTGMGSAWNVYLLTHDIEQSLDRVVPAGGSVLMAADDVADLGRFAFVQDPSGALVGFWQPGELSGIAVENEPGAPTWYELHATTAYRESISFYERVFGMTTSVLSDTEEFREVTFGEGPGAEAGIYDASGAVPPGTRSAWKVFFAVADADESAAAIVSAGGTVTGGPMDTPYGRITDAIDSTGAVFGVVQLPPDPA